MENLKRFFAECELGTADMIFQLRSGKILPWSRSTSSVSTLAEDSEPAPNLNLACRLVQIILALYLIPAFLIVCLVGVLGIFIVTVARFLGRLQGKTSS